MIEKVNWSIQLKLKSINGKMVILTAGETFDTIAKRMEFEGVEALCVEIKGDEIVFSIDDELNIPGI